MALDKQRILNELGSVVNQLQSADCGCMRNLFSNTNHGSTMGSCSGCHRGCCHSQRYNHNYTNQMAGEPHSAPMGHNMNSMCMGNCNPPKLYADTYNYLNKNLMKPVVEEVYHDLKTINPTNTIMNNPMAGQMGLSPNNPVLQGNGMGGVNQTPMSGGVSNFEYTGMAGSSTNYQNAGQNMDRSHTVPMHNMNSMRPTQQSMQPGGPAAKMSGMGAQIVNMIMGGSNAKHAGKMSTSPTIDAPQPPRANDITTPLHAGTNNNSIGMNNMIYGQENARMQNPTTQYMAGANTYNNSNMQGSPTMSNMPQNNMNTSSQSMEHNPAVPAGQQITGTNNRGYGQHSLGISKFNAMFPGVMQGGDLGFDPMSIALQMNPANHKKAAVDTMHRIMNGNSNGDYDTRNSGFKQSANTVNAVETSPQYTIPGNETTNQQMTAQQAALQSQSMQQISNSNGVAPPNQMPQQQVYTAVTAAPMNQQIQQYQQQQQYQQPQHQEQQQIFDPNTGAMITSPNLPGNQHEQTDSDAQLLQQKPSQSQNVPPNELLPPQPLIKEPIFPADTLKNRIPQNLKPHNYQYNTLGQPIELTSGQIYHSPEPQLPQTLSPQPLPTRLRHDPTKYSNVKNTVSKTSIIGHNSVGKTPSRNQMQNIYNQYKGSQSFTQQNVKGSHGTTYSDGKLNVTHGNGNTPQTRLHQVPVEKVGGDTIDNNNDANNKIPNKTDPDMGHNVDVPTPNLPSGDDAFRTEPPTKLSKCRNGLQDMIYTSYPISTAWSFHGDY